MNAALRIGVEQSRIVVVFPVSVRAVIRNARSPTAMQAACTRATPCSAKCQRSTGSTQFV